MPDIRQVHLLRARPHFAVTGDLKGGVRVWNLREKALSSTIDDQEGYRLDNAVVGISEEEAVGYLALAFSNGRISVFIVSDDAAVQRCANQSIVRDYQAGSQGKHAVCVLMVAVIF